MKQHYILIVSLFSLFLTNSIWSQSAGDIAFVGFNADGNDEFAFVSLVDIPASTSIWFTDNEWDGTDRFNNLNEGELEWNHTSILPAGSIVVIAGNSGTTATVISGLGTVSGSGLNLGGSNETLYALLSQPVSDVAMTSPGFLAGISNDLSGDSVGLLTNTGLTTGINFIDFDSDQDGFKFKAPSFGQVNFNDYLPILMDTSNWLIETSDGTLVLDGGTFAIDEFSIINLTWNGVMDNDWTNTSNWTPSNTPSATSDIIIPSGLTNYPTITTDITVKGITIASGATLIADAVITNDIIYKRNLPTTNWYLVSSPLTGETIDHIISNHTLATGTDTNLGLAPYNNNGTTVGWDYQNASSTGTINNGQGYSIKLAAPGDMYFTGTANSTSVTIPIANGSRNNLNLIGNPYTAYINSDNFFTDNGAFFSEETIWLWDGTQYNAFNAMTPIEIAPGQGFFIDASGTNTVTFATTNQSHQATDTFSKEEPTTNFELSVTNNKAISSTKVFYLDGKTTGFDNGYDSKMFDGITTDFAVFTELISNNQGNKLAIQTLPKDNTTAIPVGIIAKANEELTFSIESLNLPEDVVVYLEDKKSGEFVNLSEATYKTTLAEDSNTIGQFYIHTSAKSLSTENIIDTNNISIYKSSEQTVTITGLNAIGNVSVYSLLGKKVLSTSLESNGINTVNLPNLSSGIYIIELSSENKNLTKKVTLK